MAEDSAASGLGSPSQPPAAVSAAVAEQSSTNAEPNPNDNIHKQEREQEHGHQQQDATAPQFDTPVAKVDDDGNGPKEPEKESSVSDAQWKAMFDVVMAVYDYRAPDGHDPSRPFQRSVNKRNVPDYYDVIKEPMALSVLKKKIKDRSYSHFSQFVRDCALITHNAQIYNRPRSPVYEAALLVKQVFIAEFKKLVDQGIIPAETAQLPDLGEIPEGDPLPLEEEEEEEEEEEDEEEDEPDDSEDEGGRRKRRRGTRTFKRRDSTAKADAQNDPELRKKRGRPPRVDTPMEARIKAVLKGIRKFKDTDGLKVRHFEKLPDKSVYPDYYVEIKEPMAIDLVKRKAKRKKYNSVDHFMRDMDIMFNNAKQYNVPGSQIYKDAEFLQTEAHKLAEQEKKKPDSEYHMEDGRFPLPEGIMHKGEVWRVGDWVHIANPNDANKPIVAQIYRTWQDSEGDKWVNACWYYHPEQTVHQFEKHFYPNEVVKTGQYRDHRIEEVVDRCFVMFFTRYNRGRPKHFPAGKQVYVCEARYNEEKHKLNKIKTWASCLPDEVREKDYEMDMFDAPRKIRKIPSPIKHLLKPDAKETDDVPKPTWGAENAPPIVGAVHRRPREENESPPPEPTPSPPPQPVVPAAPAVSNKPALASQPATRPPSQNSRRPATPAGINSPMPAISNQSPAPPTPQRAAAAQPHAPINRMQPPQFHPPAAPPVSSLPPTYTGRPGHFQPQTIPQQPSAAYQAPPTAPYQQHQASYAHQLPHQAQMQQPYSAPQNFPSYQQTSRMPAPQIAPPNIYNPNAPRPVEAYTLPQSQNAAIPEDVRGRFHTNEEGQVLWFTAPPLDIVQPNHNGLRHSVTYLAARERKRQAREEYAKRKAEEIARATADAAEVAEKKKRKLEHDPTTARTLDEVKLAAMAQMVNKWESDDDLWWQARFGENAAEEKAKATARSEEMRREHQREMEEREMRLAEVNSKP